MIPEVIDDMCIAVHNCHALKILHRDIRLESFFHDDKTTLGGWNSACFNPGNMSYKNIKPHLLRNPLYLNHIEAPEMAGNMSDMIKYGFEYDMWCLGLVIFELLFCTELEREIPVGQYTDKWLVEWIDAHPLTDIKYSTLYLALLKALLASDPARRATSYTAKNLCDGPTASNLFNNNIGCLTEGSTKMKSIEDGLMYRQYYCNIKATVELLSSTKGPVLKKYLTMIAQGGSKLNPETQLKNVKIKVRKILVVKQIIATEGTTYEFRHNIRHYFRTLLWLADIVLNKKEDKDNMPTRDEIIATLSEISMKDVHLIL